MAHVLVLLMLVLSTSGAGPGPPPRPSPAELEAEAHYLRALRCFEQRSLDYRLQGLRELEEAVRLAPENATYRLALADLHFLGGSYHAARRDYERVAATDSAAAYLDLGLLWRHNWLATNDSKSLDRAVHAVMTAAWLDPPRTDAWLLLVPLYLAQHKRLEAASAAFSALESDPARLEAHLAVAATLCHLGVVGVGDSIFRATIPCLSPELRAVFERGAPLPPDGAPIAAVVPIAGVEGGAASLAPADEDRLWAWSRTTERVALLPAALRAPPGSAPRTERGPGGSGPGGSRVGLADDHGQDPLWRRPDLGVRMEVLDRLLTLRPDVPRSRTPDDAAPQMDALRALYARVLAALGGTESEGSAPPIGISADPQE
jgi:tetratricopeptide (TPR) repeat protein